MTVASEKMTGRILVVDDHTSARQSMADVLQFAGHQVRTAASAVEALQLLSEAAVDLIITDLQMPGMSGLEFIRELNQRGSDAAIVMVTAHASVSTAVDAMRRGAFDYIEKPFDADQLETLVERALRHGQTAGPRSTVPADSSAADPTMIGDSAAMRKLRQQIAQVAPTDETVLITGESGSGKELVAQSMHAKSRRAGGALVSLNCPALSPQLMESELFGHERGAFTSADAPRVGRFELAEGGTILLDEVTEVELNLQAKLLRVLQERCYERVGSNVRGLATTNRDLQEEVREGRFREDLYFRLAVVPLRVPPLRERPEDVPALIEHFLHQSAKRLQREPCVLQPQAAELLQEYSWPGNVRELENIVTRASVLNTSGHVKAEELRPWLLGTGSPHPRGIVAEGTSLHDVERQTIESTLERFEGHRTKTAAALGIGVRTLANKLKSYGYAPREKVFSRSA